MARKLTYFASALALCAATICGRAAIAQDDSANGKDAEQAVATQDGRQQDGEKPSESKAPTESQENGDDIQFDENKNGVQSSLDAAAENELNEISQTSAEDLLNLATELKLSATNVVDLTKIVSLCNRAEKLGLDDANREFSKQLRLSAQLDRGLAIAQLFMDPGLDVAQLPNGWQELRDLAINDFKMALQETDDIPLAQLSLGRLYILAQNAEGAKAAFNAAINTKEDDQEEIKAFAYFSLADIEKDLNEAIKLIDKAIELNPQGEPIFYYGASVILDKMKREDAAIARINKAIELAPENVNFKKQKAMILANARRYDEAKQVFEEATKNEEFNLQNELAKADFLGNVKDFDAAIAIFDNLAKTFDGPGVYLLRAVAKAQKKDYDGAIKDLDEALRRDPNMLQAFKLKGGVYIEQEKYEEAEKAFRQYLKKSTAPEDKLTAKTQIAYSISKRGLYKSASKILKDELAKDAENAELMRSLADMELLFGHWNAAAELYDKLLAKDPDDSGVLNNYSWLLATCPEESVRDGARALEYGKKAAEKTYYAAPHILSTLAAAYAENGDFESARSWSQKAVELGELEEHESLDSLRKELESYKADQPWRETSEIMKEVDEDAAPVSETPEPPAQ